MKPFIKYCGAVSQEDVECIAQSQADAIGFIFAPSKRQVDPDQVKQWLTESQCEKEVAGVFVNENIQKVCDITQQVPLNIVQLHGDETRDQAKEIKQQTGAIVWKVFHHVPSIKETLDKMTAFAPFVDGFLIDAKVKGMRGGSGTSFTWEAVPVYKQQAKRLGKTCIIAGGITPETLPDLLAFGPAAIDLSSGIEENGKKSSAKIKALEERMLNNVRISK
ncbi:phosphoribosylanthranilate isomerase [Bacillus pumilus]|uniref:N-(5'-phosphoribosyl)anthranilate isomerase n=1 Tax=Bacillus pumilus TaxID=1408 RepID=A0AAD0ML77_BACPU|nr:phosphoribosylanthranilate isomerase [Bacillus pumilus]AVM24402.1 phosphoribosylanthranilate isomerase [Bacillus pumilus]TYS33971.1 phosphoribosylanthranilate isomerase [Bacillus pumilus]TYS42687.1 phosphoribosylanthranilate isomerase [Bacillus pumilus]TYS49023.1 phosphoribosylanthranilate isomerase [Bacillus pumilus]